MIMENLMPQGSSGWKEILAHRLPLYGHRNWIAVVDSAYPLQASPGVETSVADAGQTEVLQAVFDALDQAKHVRPIIFLDAELDLVPEEDAPGITEYRSQVARILGKRDVTRLPHEEIIGKLDQASATFNVLVLKTTMIIPYTSVFLQLDCNYWSDAAERRLRAELSDTPESGASFLKEQ